MPIKNSFHGTVRAIHQMAGRSECEAREARLSLTASRAEHARISGRSGNNSAYLEFCLRIAEKFIGNEGPITVDQVLAGEKLKYYADAVAGFLAQLPEPSYFDYLRENPETHRLLAE